MSTEMLSSDNSDQLELFLNRVKMVAGSQKDIRAAELLGVDRSYIPAWRKRGTIPYSRLLEFANSQGIALEWLFFGRGPMRANQMEEDPGLYRSGHHDPKALAELLICYDALRGAERAHPSVPAMTHEEAAMWATATRHSARAEFDDDFEQAHSIIEAMARMTVHMRANHPHVD